MLEKFVFGAGSTEDIFVAEVSRLLHATR